MGSYFLIDWTAITVISTVVTAVAASVVACLAYKAHQLARGYFARVFVFIYLNPEDDVAEEKNFGDENREIVVLVENDEDKSAKIKSFRCHFKKFMSANEQYKETLDDIRNVVTKDLDGVVVKPNEKHRYTRNLAEIKEQAKGRKYFCVSVKHSLSPKPATATLRLSS